MPLTLAVVGLGWVWCVVGYCCKETAEREGVREQRDREEWRT